MLNGLNGNSTSPSALTGTCNQCGDKKGVLPYIFPTQNGKKEFCSEPCLSGYRNAQKGIHTLNIQVHISKPKRNLESMKKCTTIFSSIHYKNRLRRLNRQLLPHHQWIIIQARQPFLPNLLQRMSVTPISIGSTI